MSGITTIPENIKSILDIFVLELKKCLGDNLVGVYLHGSLAMGGFNPKGSDIDLLVVAINKLSILDKQKLGDVLLKLTEKGPDGGIEMSVLLLESLQNFQYPTPYEFHFSNEHKDAFRSGTIDLEAEKTDADLAAHVVITKNRGLCLFGKPIAEVFPDVPSEFYLQSIRHDFDWSYTNVMRGPETGQGWVPKYAVLNACRIAAYVKEGLITSKIEGAQWALKHLPAEYRVIVQMALNEYKKSDRANVVDLDLLKQFMNYIKQVISK